MIVLIDIGNSYLKYLMRNSSVDDTVISVKTDLINRQWFKENVSQAKKIILASVNQSILTTNIKLWAEESNIVFQQVVSEPQGHGVLSGYKHYQQLGVDRWLALIGAWYKYPQTNSLIIDAGTATTIDVLDNTGQHQGGWILPGVVSMHRSVLNDTANVQASHNHASIAFADNTSDNVNNACWAATVGAIHLAMQQSTKQNIQIDQVILTGGGAKSLSQLISIPHIQEPNLVFLGLKNFI